MRDRPVVWRFTRAGTTVFALLASTLAVAGDMGGGSRETRPNIVWVWADNLGYGDVGCYGSEHIETPVIDGVAASGVTLDAHYVAHTVCSPSRAALLTGRQPYRVGIVDVLRPDGPSGLPDEEITLAEALGGLGYATCAVGKWHLGDRAPYLPTEHGFDQYLGIPYSMDMKPTVLIEGSEVVERLPGKSVAGITERFTNYAIEFVRRERDGPFFVYFSHTIPHPPINLPEACITDGRPIYYDAIEHMDAEFGRLLDAIERLGLESRTLVVFTSDNGPMHRDGSAGHLRGGIRDSYEGGLRVPAVLRYPGVLPEGHVVEEPTIMYDIFPTLVELAGGRLPTDREYDGVDIWPLLTGDGAVQRQEPFVWVYEDNVTALRRGPWKLHLGNRSERFRSPLLYHLERDPGEKDDVSGANAGLVEELAGWAREYESEVPHVWTLKYPVRDPAKRPGGIRRE